MDARDRIGPGPWHNQAGVLIATDVDHLHSDDANLTTQSILTETGAMVNGWGDTPRAGVQPGRPPGDRRAGPAGN